MKTSSPRTLEFTLPGGRPRIGTFDDKSSVRQRSEKSSPIKRRRRRYLLAAECRSNCLLMQAMYNGTAQPPTPSAIENWEGPRLCGSSGGVVTKNKSRKFQFYGDSYKLPTGDANAETFNSPTQIPPKEEIFQSYILYFCNKNFRAQKKSSNNLKFTWPLAALPRCNWKKLDWECTSSARDRSEWSCVEGFQPKASLQSLACHASTDAVPAEFHWSTQRTRMNEKMSEYSFPRSSLIYSLYTALNEWVSE